MNGNETAAPAAPLIGRLVHGAVQVTGIAGLAWLGWERAGDGIAGVALGVAVARASTFLWFGVSAPSDPESNRLSVVPIRGRVRIVLEILLILAGGSALWMAWTRAAGETYLTAAFIDMVVRYPRLAALYREQSIPGG